MTRDHLIGLLSVVAVLCAWESMVAVRWLDPIIMSSPTRIGRAAIEIGSDPGFSTHIRTSAAEFAIGYASGAVTGALLGFVVGWYRRIRLVIDPAMTVFYVVPRVAWLPILVLWFGLGTVSTTAVVFLGVFFMVVLSTMAGVRTVDTGLVQAGRAFMASDWTIFRAIVVPSTIPSLIAGLRLGVGRGLIGLVIGELFSASAGLGYLIHVTAATLQIDKMFVAVLLVSTTGLVMNGLLTLAERRLEHWRGGLRRA